MTRGDWTDRNVTVDVCISSCAALKTSSSGPAFDAAVLFSSGDAGPGLKGAAAERRLRSFVNRILCWPIKGLVSELTFGLQAAD